MCTDDLSTLNLWAVNCVGICVYKCASVYGEEEREDRRKANLAKKLCPGSKVTWVLVLCY